MSSIDREDLLFVIIVISLLAMGCWLVPLLTSTVTPTVTPTPEPTITPTTTPTVTPAPTLTPQFVALPPPGVLADMIMAEAEPGFRYLPWHYISEDTTIWLVFGWPEEDDRTYKAVFAFEGGKWALLEVEKVGEEGREAWADN